MNEFDLKGYLYNNPLLESEAKLKAAKKKLENQEDKLDKVDMKDEDAKEKAKHHKDTIKNVKKEIKDLERDLKFDEKAEKKEKKEEKKSVKEAHRDRDGYMTDRRDPNPEEKRERKMVDNMPKMTREGLKSMIREKITSILNEEEELMEQEEDKVDVDDENIVNVKDKNVTDVDVEKEKEVDDVSKETDIDVKTSLPGESEDVDAILGLLTKASEEADRFSDDPELKTQIGNTITYFTRKHIAKPTNEELEGEVNELFGFGKKKRARSGGSDSKGFSMFAYGKDGGKRNIGSGKTAKEARRDGDFQNYRRRYAVDKFEVVNNDTGEVVDTMRG